MREGAFTGNPREHPAACAWRELGGRRAEPEGVEILTLKPKSAVFRLCGAGPKGASVIAKRCAGGGGSVERTIYEDVLPRLPLVRLEYHGFVTDDEAGHDWLFLGDAGEAPFLPNDPEHQRLAAEWLATRHGAARIDPDVTRAKNLRRQHRQLRRDLSFQQLASHCLIIPIMLISRQWMNI